MLSLLFTLYYYSRTFVVSGLTRMSFLCRVAMLQTMSVFITTHELSSCQVSHACLFHVQLQCRKQRVFLVSIMNFCHVTSRTRKLVMPYLQQVCMVQVFLCVFTWASWLRQVSNTKQETLLIFVYK